MKLYKRDYLKITEEEKKEYEKVKEREIIEGSPFRRCLNYEYPKAMRHYLSLFPNNFMDISDLHNKAQIREKSESFLTLLNSLENKEPERQILRHIKNSESHFLVASILNNHFDFGHHDAYVFPEFKIGPYFVDYLIVGQNTGGYEFVFCEFESPVNKGSKKITLKDGSFGGVIRDGKKQIKEWKRLLQSNFKCVEESFRKELHPERSLPNEFIEYDASRMHYVIVAGRRDDFNESSHREKRELSNDCIVIYYDRLYDYAIRLIDSERFTY
mgnify:CR=1 FL=1